MSASSVSSRVWSDSVGRNQWSSESSVQSAGSEPSRRSSRRRRHSASASGSVASSSKSNHSGARALQSGGRNEQSYPEQSYPSEFHSEPESSSPSASASLCTSSGRSPVESSARGQSDVSSVLESSVSDSHVSGTSVEHVSKTASRGQPAHGSDRPRPPVSSDAAVQCYAPVDCGVQCNEGDPCGREPVDPIMAWAALGSHRLSLPSSFAASQARLAIASSPYDICGPMSCSQPPAFASAVPASAAHPYFAAYAYPPLVSVPLPVQYPAFFAQHAWSVQTGL